MHSTGAAGRGAALLSRLFGKIIIGMKRSQEGVIVHPRKVRKGGSCRRDLVRGFVYASKPNW